MNETTLGNMPEPLTISRSFPAPRHLVFQAWSTAEHMKAWFCPAHFTVPHATIDFRPDGVCEICMRAPDGQEFWSKGRYVEITAPARLVFTSSVMDDNDAPRFTAHTTVTFEAEPGGTRVTVHQAYESLDETAWGAIAGAPEGWRTTLDRLEREVARIAAAGRSAVHGTFRLERNYAAAPPKVFHALTDKEAKARWFGGGDLYIVQEREMDVRVGGRESLIGLWTSGVTTNFSAIYHEIVPNQRLVYTYEMHLDDRKISVSLATIELYPAGEGTRFVVTEQGVFLDGYDDAGSREHGTGFLIDRLGALLEA